MAASEALPYAKSVLNGVYDSILGIITFFKPIYQKQDNVQHTPGREVEEINVTRSKRRPRQTTSTLKTQSYKEIYSMMLQCCILNGGIFWMSILLFENYLIPILQKLTFFIFKTITGSETTQSLMWKWMVPALSYIFRAFWVIPLFWLTKPLNSLWYQEIADLAYRRRSGKPTVLLSSSGSLAQNVSLTIADIFFSLLIQSFFLLQATLVGIVPVVGPVLSLLHMTLLHSLYCFEYTWVNRVNVFNCDCVQLRIYRSRQVDLSKSTMLSARICFSLICPITCLFLLLIMYTDLWTYYTKTTFLGWRVDKRLAFIETNWPYFVGFGLPLAVLTNVPSSFVVSGCIFAILFPLFIVSGNEAQPVETESVPVHIFSVSIWLTNKILRRSWSKTKLQSKTE